MFKKLSMAASALCLLALLLSGFALKSAKSKPRESNLVTVAPNQISSDLISIIKTDTSGGKLSVTAKNRTTDRTAIFVCFDLGGRPFQVGRDDANVRLMKDADYLARTPELKWKPEEVRTFTFDYNITIPTSLKLRTVFFDNGTGWFDGCPIIKSDKPNKYGVYWIVDKPELEKQYKRERLIGSWYNPGFYSVQDAKFRPTRAKSQACWNYDVAHYETCNTIPFCQVFVWQFVSSTSGRYPGYNLFQCFDGSQYCGWINYDSVEGLCP